MVTYAATPAIALRRRNLALAWGLFIFTMLVATSIFTWRFMHHTPALPQGAEASQVDSD